MKRCPKCQQVFYDDYQFCLIDGSVLVEPIFEDEQETVFRPAQSSAESLKSKKPPILLICTTLTLSLLLVIFVGLWALGADFSSATGNATSNAEREVIENQKTSMRNQQAELELEKQRLAAERKEQEKREADVSVNSEIADPATRITFRRGSIQETQTGSIVMRRVYFLRTLAGQFLEAEIVSSNNCVVFTNGSTYISHSTGKGDNRIIIVNKCRDRSSYSLTTTVR